MIFGLFKQPTFEDHYDRLGKILYKAYDRFCTADERMAHKNINLSRACVGQAVKILDEAMYIAQEAIKLIENQEQKERLEKVVHQMLVTNLMGDPCGNFAYDNVKEAWDKAVGSWLSQFNDYLSSN